MDFHRNAHGKSRLICFPVPVSLVVPVVLKSLWWVLFIRWSLPRVAADPDDIYTDLGCWLLMMIPGRPVISWSAAPDSTQHVLCR